MSSGRTIYHVLFGELLRERGPKNFAFSFDVTLTTEPQRADVIVVRRAAGTADAEAHTLLHLWPLLPDDAVIEYKSPVRPLRRGGLAKLVGYGAQYHARESGRLRARGQLALVLVVASWTRTLDEELAVFGWSVEALGSGYYRVPAQPYALYVAVVDEVSQAENDALLDLVGHRTMDSLEAYQWVLQHTTESPEGRTMDKLEGFEELYRQVSARLPIAMRLAGLKPEEVVGRFKPEEIANVLKPEERLLGLKPEEQILALSNEVLAGFPQSYLATLPGEVREEIARRLGRH